MTWDAEYRSETHPGGSVQFGGVREGKKNISAVFATRDLKVFRFFEQTFEYAGGKYFLETVSPLCGGEVMLGIRSNHQMLAGRGLDVNLVLPGKKAGSPGFGISLRMTPGRLVVLEGLQGRQALLNLDPGRVLSREGIALRDRHPRIDNLQAVTWVDVSCIEEKRFSLRCTLAINVPDKHWLRALVVFDDGMVGECGYSKAVGGLGLIEGKNRRRAMYAYVRVSTPQAEVLAVGSGPVSKSGGVYELRAGKDVTIKLGGDLGGRSMSLVSPELYDRGIDATPWRSDVANGRVTFKAVAYPASYGVFLDGKRRGTISVSESEQDFMIK